MWEEYKDDRLAELYFEHLSKYYGIKLRKILRKYKSLSYGTLGDVVAIEDFIYLTEGVKPVRQLPYRSGLGSSEVLKDYVEKILKLGVIDPPTTPRASPVVLVPKKDGTCLFCVDYRILNETTVRDSYPLPRMDEFIDSLGDSKYMSTLYCYLGY